MRQFGVRIKSRKQFVNVQRVLLNMGKYWAKGLKRDYEITELCECGMKKFSPDNVGWSDSKYDKQFTVLELFGYEITWSCWKGVLGGTPIKNYTEYYEYDDFIKKYVYLLRKEKLERILK